MTPHPRQFVRLRRASAGHSLIEMVLAVGILALVLLGAQSAVMIAARATPSRADANSRAASTAACLSAMADDLGVATAISTAQGRVVEFTVPDRTGDGFEDSIRYSWSGTPGEPLIRTINGGDPEIAVSEVLTLSLDYETEVAASEATYSESAEMVVASFATATSTTAQPVGKYSGNTYLRGQWFLPTLPADAVSWSITRAAFTCRQGNNIDSVAQVQIRTARKGEPTPRVVSATSIVETGMSSSWRTLEVSDIQCTGLRTDEAACLVLHQTSGSDYFEILVQRSKTLDTYHVSSTNGGSSWSKPTESMIFTVWGRVVRPDVTTVQAVLSRVRYTIQLGDEASATITGDWAVLNRPGVTIAPPAAEEDPDGGALSLEVK